MSKVFIFLMSISLFLVISCEDSGGTDVVDSIAPVPGNSGDISIQQIGAPYYCVWIAASDNITPVSNLRYIVYQSYNAVANIDSVEDCEANGTDISGVLTGETTFAVTWDSAGTYYYNVVVFDAAGNKAAYTISDPQYIVF